VVKMDKTPVFVKIDEYKDVLDVIDLIKNKLAEAKSTISKINDLKNQEDSELELWHNEIADIERKMTFVDETLIEPDNT